jgi:hypothetical protein
MKNKNHAQSLMISESSLTQMFDDTGTDLPAITHEIVATEIIRPAGF